MDEPHTGEHPKEDQVLDYWAEIASDWTTTIRTGRIESRERVTNASIIRAILDRKPHSVLDVGCGEGWLCRALRRHGIHTIGVDAVAELISKAKAADSGEYHVMSYRQLAAEGLHVAVDLVVCNFSLLGKESVDRLMPRIPSFLRPGGTLVLQTIHPATTTDDQPYADGWRESSWQGITDDITDPSPWYFRTLESWTRLIVEGGLDLVEIREPVHPDRGQPVSVILVAVTR